MSFNTTLCVAFLASIVAIRYPVYGTATMLTLAVWHFAIPQPNSDLPTKRQLLSTLARVFEPGECPVCYDDYLKVNGSVKFPCGHEICVSCRKVVLDASHLCPACRRPLFLPGTSKIETYRQVITCAWLVCLITWWIRCAVVLMMAEGLQEILRCTVAIAAPVLVLYAIVELGRQRGEQWRESFSPGANLDGSLAVLNGIPLIACLFGINANLAALQGSWLEFWSAV